MAGALLTDLYELNMAASYTKRGMVGPAVFSLFVRRLPANRGFLVAAGLEDCLRFLEGFCFEAEDLGYLRTIGLDDETLKAFAALRFTGEVRAVPEGRVVFAGEPLLEVTGIFASGGLDEFDVARFVRESVPVDARGERSRRRAPASPSRRERTARADLWSVQAKEAE